MITFKCKKCGFIVTIEGDTEANKDQIKKELCGGCYGVL